MAWNRYTRKSPPLEVIIPQYLGYQPPADETPRTVEEHAARLLSQLGAIG